MKRVVVQSRERCANETSQRYTNDMTKHELGMLPVTSIGLAGISLPPTQKTVEPDWGSMHVIEGFASAAGSTFGAGNVVASVPPSSMYVESIDHSATAPAELGGGPSIALNGSFGEYFDAVTCLATWSEVLGRTVQLHGVLGKGPLDLVIGEVLGNTESTIWISTASGTAAATWSLSSSVVAPAGYIVWGSLPTPASVANVVSRLASGPSVGAVDLMSFALTWDGENNAFVVTLAVHAEGDPVPDIVGSQDMMDYTGFSRANPAAIWRGMDAISPPNYRAWNAPSLGAVPVTVSPGNYGTAVDLSEELDSAFSSATLGSGLSIGVRSGTVGAWTAVALRPGTYGSAADFYSVLQSDLIDAGFAASVSGLDAQMRPTVGFGSIHQIDWSSALGFGHSGVRTAVLHVPTTPSDTDSFGMKNSYDVILDGGALSISARVQDAVVVSDVVSSTSNLFLLSTSGPHNRRAGDPVLVSWTGGTALAVVHEVTGVLEIEVLFGGSTPYPGVTGDAHGAEIILAGDPPVVSVFAGHSSSLRPRLTGFSSFITYGGTGGAGDALLSGPVAVADSAVNTEHDGHVMVEISINGRPVPGGITHYVSGAESKRLLKPIARVALPGAIRSSIDIDNHHATEIYGSIEGGLTRVGVAFYNEDHRPYATHGVDNSLTLTLAMGDPPPLAVPGDLFVHGIAPRLSHRRE